MRFSYSLNNEKTTYYFGQMDMNKSSTYIGIEIKAEDKYGEYVEDFIELYINPESAQQLIDELQASLNTYKEKYMK